MMGIQTIMMDVLVRAGSNADIPAAVQKKGYLSAQPNVVMGSRLIQKLAMMAIHIIEMVAPIAVL